jgi:hypothetical protein
VDAKTVWYVAVPIAYTMSSLWIIAQSIVTER